jgi:hypothetical protein
MTFGVMREGGRVVHRSFEPGRAELAPAAKKISELSRELRPHPLRVLFGEAHWRRAELSAAGRFEIEVVLTNRGRQPLAITNPAQSPGALRLGFLRPNQEQAAHLPVGQAEVHPAAGTPATPTVTLPPGQSWSFSVGAKVPVRPGRYLARVSVVSTNSGGPEELLQGTLELDPGPVQVTP